ncbi:hypothetical protein B0T11DRAFT_352549 [Plectosphaerella cucumerina]|uniref:Uncharacterized protein n=1 Tax=Plectosphaerella cucumerina TaxID=40658 RepID=A0A8K0X3X5_9PEZI|nr:hypothetical protein B0T11DRAFT_352549 [Plectosphaerella cucumerina]
MGGKLWSALEERVFWTVIVPMAAQGREAPTQSAFAELVPRMIAMGEPDRRNYNEAILYEHWHLNAVQMTFSPNGRMHALRWIRDEPARCLALGMRSRYNIVNGTITTDKGEVIKLPAGSASNAIANHNQSLASRPRSAAPTPSSQAPNNPDSINQPLSGQTSGPQAPSTQAPNIQLQMSKLPDFQLLAVVHSVLRLSILAIQDIRLPVYQLLVLILSILRLSVLRFQVIRLPVLRLPVLQLLALGLLPHVFSYSHGGPNNFGSYGPAHGFGPYGQSPIAGYSYGQARALPSPTAPPPASTRGTNRLSIQTLLSQPEEAHENSDTMFISARDLFDEADEKKKAIAAKQEAALHSIETGSAKKARPDKPKYVVYFGPDDHGQAKPASTPPPNGTKGKGAKKFTIFKHESVDSQHQRHGDNSEALSKPAAQSSHLPLVPQHRPQRPDLAQDNARWEREIHDNAAEMRRLQERNSQLARLSWENMAYHHPPQPLAVWRPAPSGYYDHREYPVGGYQSPGPYQDPGYYHRGPAPGSYYGRDSEEERREEERREMERRRYYQREQ